MKIKRIAHLESPNDLEAAIDFYQGPFEVTEEDYQGMKIGFVPVVTVCRTQDVSGRQRLNFGKDAKASII
jgi:predicted enzyme related to lactoylglutathione lyase